MPCTHHSIVAGREYVDKEHYKNPFFTLLKMARLKSPAIFGLGQKTSTSIGWQKIHPMILWPIETGAQRCEWSLRVRAVFVDRL
jgi:hypothetical protein